MKNILESIKSALVTKQAHAKKNKLLKGSMNRFFKTGIGDYSENDQFLEIPTPLVRKVALEFSMATLEDSRKLLKSPFHEFRLAGLLIVVERQKKALKKGVLSHPELLENALFYLEELLRVGSGINNWDLIDLSAPWLLGEAVYALEGSDLRKKLFVGKLSVSTVDKPFALLYALASSKDLWHRRVAMCSNLALIKRGVLIPTWEIGSFLSSDRRDLNQKVVGWILREAGKKDQKALLKLIEEKAMGWPRTLLRSAIERIDEPLRSEILERTRKGTVKHGDLRL